MKCDVVITICNFKPKISRFQNRNIYANFKPGNWTGMRPKYED